MHYHQSAYSAAKADPSKNLLSNDESAAYIGVTPRTLEVWRCTQRHRIPYLKVGRLVKYRLADLDSWLESRMVGGRAA